MGTSNQDALETMGDGEFRLFRELVRSRCGIRFCDETRFLLEKRVRSRMAKLGIHTYSAYHLELRNSSWREGEFSALLDDLTTNETYFFRERRQLHALIAELLPEALSAREERGGGPVTIWSAGCSSGEEPYSVAILAREAGIDPETELRIYASDISKRVLRQARRGSYREGAFRQTEPELRQRYFDEKDGSWVISDEVKRSVHFIHLNLMDAASLALLAGIDIILCRNVIIYFDHDGKRDLVKTFEEKLRPGGHLLLGHSESLASISNSLELRHLKNDLVYRRPSRGLSSADTWHFAAERAIGGAEQE